MKNVFRDISTRTVVMALCAAMAATMAGKALTAYIVSFDSPRAPAGLSDGGVDSPSEVRPMMPSTQERPVRPMERSKEEGRRTESTTSPMARPQKPAEDGVKDTTNRFDFFLQDLFRMREKKTESAPSMRPSAPQQSDTEPLYDGAGSKTIKVKPEGNDKIYFNNDANTWVQPSGESRSVRPGGSNNSLRPAAPKPMERKRVSPTKNTKTTR